jgi:hypothetical protein
MKILKFMAIISFVLIILSCSKDLTNETYSDGFNTIVISDGKLIYTQFTDGDTTIENVFEVEYEMQSVSGIDIYNITQAKNFEFKKMLILKSTNILIIYNEMSKNPWFFGVSGISTNMLEGFWIGNKIYIDPTSELNENGHPYLAQNLGNLAVETPWVEGVSGGGIGESVVADLKPEKGKRQVPSGFVLINGYISIEKPELYQKNGRVKKLKLTGIESKEERIINIEDTPNPQYIDYPFAYNEDIRITILETYLGSMYEDTCINSLIPYYGVDLK